MKRKILIPEINLGQNDLPRWVSQVSRFLDSRTVLLLIGPVGSGKTTLVSILGKARGFSEMASPTFAIHHRYGSGHSKDFDHVDLYRLKDEDDLESTGFWDLFAVEQGLIIVEWGNLLSEASELPELKKIRSNQLYIAKRITLLIR